MLGSNVISNFFSGGKSGYSSEPNECKTIGNENVIPINDMHLHSKEEKQNENKFKIGESETENVLRCKLAATCRLIAKYNLTFGIYNHVTVRSPDNPSLFLINPFGLNYEEITASSLVKVNASGEIKEKGRTPFGVNKAGFILHSAIHSARPDINCVLHVHTHAGITISALRKGLIPLSQESILPLNTLGYLPYEGIINEDKFRGSIAKSLGQKNKILILHNHGIVSCGATVEEAWANLYMTLYACETQWRTLAAVGGNIHDLILPNEAALEQAKKALVQEQAGLNIGSNIKWGVGEMEFEAEMRYLDNRGFKTGYPYKVKIQLSK